MPYGLREPIVRHDDTGTYEHFVVLPASQWAAVTGLPERWQNDPRNEPEDNHDDFGDGRGTAARECARELEQVVKEVDRG